MLLILPTELCIGDDCSNKLTTAWKINDLITQFVKKQWKYKNISENEC